MKDIFLECGCHSEMVRVEKQEDNEYWFTFWEEGFYTKDKCSFFERLKVAFLVFKRGYAYTDMVILNKEKVDKLVEFLKE